MPSSSTIDDIQNAYIEAWKMGLKCVAIYRDGSKRSQPLNTSTNKTTEDKPIRRRLPDTRKALTHKFTIGEHEGYITAGFHDNGDLGELFVTMSKAGSTINGLMDNIATIASMALQYGVPLADLVKKFSHQRFEPSGHSKNTDIGWASSIIDYVFRWVATLPQPNSLEKKTTAQSTMDGDDYQIDAPLCPVCGHLTTRNGTCFRCLNCGESLGCS